MGEYCYACSIELFGKDSKDFRGLTSDKSFRDGKACLVLCEGCGKIQVDPYGKCLSEGCFKSGLSGHSCSWELPITVRKGILFRMCSFIFGLLSRLLK